MEIIQFLALSCLIIFMVLATYDGAYLHLWKYELFDHQESRFEHLTHTLRAILFPLITWTLFVATDDLSFYLGLSLVLLDLIILAIDALSEKDSRSFMGGLPHSEYILHLFANGFHFAAVMLIIGSRISISEGELLLSTQFLHSGLLDSVQWVGMNILPGSIVLALLHLALLSETGRALYKQQRMKISCC